MRDTHRRMWRIARLLPASWRDTIWGDLEEEARAEGHGTWWLAWQVGIAAALLRTETIRDATAADTRYAVRSLWRAPWFAIGAVLTFAVGFGVNLATFAAVDRILFRPAPYPSAHRLLVLQACTPGTDTCFNNFPDQLFVAAGRTRLQTLGEFASSSFASPYPMSAASGDQPPLRLVAVTANLLRVLDVRPLLGRGPSDVEAAAAPYAALLSYETWKNRFGGDDAVLGRIVGVAPTTARIVGILPAGFVPPSPGVLDPTWEGLVFTTKVTIFSAVARLEPGATVGQAQSEVSALVDSLRAGSDPSSRARLSRTFIRVQPIDRALFSMVVDDAWVITVVVGLLLIMACANLSALMLARGASRAREVALQTALGASGRRIILTSITETGVICLAGAAVAWCALLMASRSLRAVLPPVFARYLAAALDLRVLFFALVVAAMVAVVAGVWPGIRATRVDVVTTLGQAATNRGPRLAGGRMLLAIESGLGVAVVVTAALAIVSFETLLAKGVGYRPDGLYCVSVLRTGTVPPEQSLAEYKLTLAAASEMPGVVGVAGGDSVVGNGATAMRGFSADPAQRGGRYELSAGALAAMGTTLIAGREFTREEVESGAPVAMVNEGGAALVAPGVPLANVVGRTIQVKGESPRLVVGVVPDLAHARYGQAEEAALYVPLGAQPRNYGDFLIRMAPGARPDVTLLGQRLAAVVGPRRVTVTALPDSLAASLVTPRFRAVLFGAIALCALVLSCAGLYALAAFEVSRRTKEMGIRLALGASAGRIRAFLAAEVFRPVLVGTALGLTVAFWAGRFLRVFLYQLDGREPAFYAGAALLILITAAATIWSPARRASRTDPAGVLRTE